MECPTLWSKIMVLMGIDPVTYRRSNFFNNQTFTSWHFKTHFEILLSSAKNSHESCFEYTGLCNAWEYVLGFTRQTVSCSITLSFRTNEIMYNFTVIYAFHNELFQPPQRCHHTELPQRHQMDSAAMQTVHEGYCLAFILC